MTEPPVRQFELCADNATKYGHEWKRERNEFRSALRRLVEATDEARRYSWMDPTTVGVFRARARRCPRACGKMP